MIPGPVCDNCGRFVLTTWEGKCMDCEKKEGEVISRDELLNILLDVDGISVGAAADAILEALGERVKTLDVVLDGPPESCAGRFVEVENLEGESVKAGEWIDRGDGYWALRLEVVV